MVDDKLTNIELNDFIKMREIPQLNPSLQNLAERLQAYENKKRIQKSIQVSESTELKLDCCDKDIEKLNKHIETYIYPESMRLLAIQKRAAENVMLLESMYDFFDMK